MSEPAPLRELRELLSAFLARPLGGTLVIGCLDPDMLLLLHALDSLDTASPADRFLIYGAPFTAPEPYTDDLVDLVARVTQRPPPPVAEPIVRLRMVITDLLAGLPIGDHRLVVALAPIHIRDPAAFTALVTPLLTPPFPDVLRIVLRDDLAAPRHFRSAATCPARQVVAHEFHLPVGSHLSDAATIARDPVLPPDARSQALLQLGLHAITHGHLDEAVASCEAALGLAESPQILAMALAFHADALHARGNLTDARDGAALALTEALACNSSPIVLHAAMSLGELSQRLGDRETATACFELVERTAIQNPHLQTLAREKRFALALDPPC